MTPFRVLRGVLSRQICASFNGTAINQLHRRLLVRQTIVQQLNPYVRQVRALCFKSKGSVKDKKSDEQKSEKEIAQLLKIANGLAHQYIEMNTGLKLNLQVD